MSCNILEACYRLWQRTSHTLQWTANASSEIKSDFVTGDWYRAVSARFSTVGLKILAILLHSDATIVTSFGSRSCHPITMTFGNLPTSEISKSRHRFVVGFFPQLPPKIDRRTKLTIMHKCIRILLQPLLRMEGISRLIIRYGVPHFCIIETTII